MARTYSETHFWNPRVGSRIPQRNGSRTPTISFAILRLLTSLSYAPSVPPADEIKKTGGRLASLPRFNVTNIDSVRGAEGESPARRPSMHVASALTVG